MSRHPLRDGRGAVAAGIARAIATIGLSAVLQDMLGMITFDAGFEHMGVIRPRVGRGHVIHCLDAYQGRVTTEASSAETTSRRPSRAGSDERRSSR